jgi:GNAT superfamily N-acetyltransferase
MTTHFENSHAKGRAVFISVRAIASEDRDWVVDFLHRRWRSDRCVAHGVVYYPADMPGFIAEVDGERMGLLTHEIVGESCEVVIVDSGERGGGVGTALMEVVRRFAVDSGCSRLWLVTTNDNLDALRFYQRRGFVLAALRPDALSESRRLKPEIPLVGQFGILLRDELELEMRLDGLNLGLTHRLFRTKLKR